MTPLFFGTKRAYYATLRVTRRYLARMGLTAARFDLLHALVRLLPGRTRCEQSILREALGVARSTVSRMLKSLEALGLVRRERDLEFDRRQVVVCLTVEGRRRAWRAFRCLVRSGLVDLATDSALSPSRRHYPHPGACDRARRALARLHGRLRVALGDGATLYAPQPNVWVPGPWWAIERDREHLAYRFRCFRRETGDPVDWPLAMMLSETVGYRPLNRHGPND